MNKCNKSNDIFLLPLHFYKAQEERASCWSWTYTKLTSSDAARPQENFSLGLRNKELLPWKLIFATNITIFLTKLLLILSKDTIFAMKTNKHMTIRFANTLTLRLTLLTLWAEKTNVCEYPDSIRFRCQCQHLLDVFSSPQQQGESSFFFIYLS